MNIDNWSIDDILTLFELENPDPQQVTLSADRLITKAMANDNTAVATFLKQAKDKVLSFVAKEQEEGSFSEQASDQLMEWWQNQYLTQSDKNQANKTTSRNNKVQTFTDNDHFQMKRDTLGINQSYSVPVAQGTINPNLKNIVERTIIIDSQFRPTIFPYAEKDITSPSFGSSFSTDLSDTLSNVLSLSLYSVHIPKTWYNISGFIGNNCYSVSNNIESESPSEEWTYVEPGYYTPSQLESEWANATSTSILEIKYDPIKNRFGVKMSSTVYNYIIWYGRTGAPENCQGCLKVSFPNNNLGWTLGFRGFKNNILYTDMSNPDSAGYVWAESTPSLSGPQYLLLTLDDYNHNRLNKGIISTNNTQTKLDLPSYFNKSTFSCDTSNNAFAVKSAPRQLTQAQLYTINTIHENRQQQKVRTSAPTSNNVLAIISVGNVAYGDTISLYGEDIESNTREYFGPVTIERIKASILDDKGNILDLNGADWSFTFKVKQLYQY